MQPMGRSACTQSALIVFSFFLCSQHVPFKFPVAHHFNPICFAQSPPPLTYIDGPMGEALYLSVESSI
jgi:hypothetical protein